MKNKKSKKIFNVPIILGQTTVTILVPKENLGDLDLSESQFLSCIIAEDNELIIKNKESINRDY
jgi:hypothetical protein